MNGILGFVTLVFINYIFSATVFFLIPYIDYANIMGVLSLIYYSLTIIPTILTLPGLKTRGFYIHR